MRLLIDVGNTRLKLATLDGQNMTFVTAMAIESAAQLRLALQQALHTLGQSRHVQIQACAAVSVGSADINEAVQVALGSVPLNWIRATTEAAGVKNGYPDPSQLGADRWVAMIGLTRHFTEPHPPVVLASFGTATTVDTLGADNTFRGGLILPGVSLMHHALARGTAKLPNTVGTLAEFPTNTASAITSGIAAAQAGAVMRQIELVRQADGQQPLVCVTGGAWPAVQAELNRHIAPDNLLELPHVVLDGLAMLAH